VAIPVPEVQKAEQRQPPVPAKPVVQAVTIQKAEEQPKPVPGKIGK
jgi:hypothetical protein